MFTFSNKNSFVDALSFNFHLAKWSCMAQSGRLNGETCWQAGRQRLFWDSLRWLQLLRAGKVEYAIVVWYTDPLSEWLNENEISLGTPTVAVRHYSGATPTDLPLSPSATCTAGTERSRWKDAKTLYLWHHILCGTGSTESDPPPVSAANHSFSACWQWYVCAVAIDASGEYCVPHSLLPPSFDRSNSRRWWHYTLSACFGFFCHLLSLQVPIAYLFRFS